MQIKKLKKHHYHTKGVQMFEIVAFIIFSVLTISMFSITVLTNNALYALSSLAAGMIFISGFFFILNADFLGTVQIVVYTGAVMALYAFGMMFFDSLSEVKERIKNPRLVFLLSGMVALIVVVVLIAPIIGQNVEANYPMHPEYGNSVDVGLVLFTKYLLPFELAAIMLLVAMIGGIVLAGKKMNESYSEMKEDEIDEKIRFDEISSKDIK
jgi:NADH-quinone oxidoreductase subunit J